MNRSSLNRSKSHVPRAMAASQMMALEPRMLFDSAAAATADHDFGDAGERAQHASVQSIASSAASAETPRELLVVDPSVHGWQQLIEGAKPGIEVLLLDAAVDAIAQIEARAAQGAPVAAIYILSHGRAGEVTLGATKLNDNSIARFSGALAALGTHLTADADLLLYGCDVAQSSSFVAALANLTGADVAASTDATGAARLGGNWALESQYGSIESRNPLALESMAAYADLLAPTPVLTLTSGASGDLTPTDQDVFIGEAFTFKATFNNTVDPGYAPYIDIHVPTTGIDGAGAAIDDGITLTGASFLGEALVLKKAHVVTAAEKAAGGWNHPLFRDTGGGRLVAIPASIQAGDIVYVYELPFGSITAGFPALEINVSGLVSNLADLNTPINIVARAGFRLGADALDNFATDPSVIQSGTATLAINPVLYTVRTEYVGPESETATGPNYVRQVRVVVDIADGQTLTNLDLTSLLPINAQFVSVDAGASTAGSLQASSTATTTAPGGNLVWRVPTITGGTGASDASFVYSFYVPEFDAASARVINASSGDDVSVNFNTTVQGNWTPVDTRDPVQAPLPLYNPVTNELTINAKSIAIQKGIAIQTNIGDTGYSPGDVVRYTLEIQVSDYFALGNNAGNMIITDVLSDGQLFSANYTPTITVSRENGGSFVRLFAGSEFTVDNSAHAAGNGETTITFDLNEIITRLGSTGGAGGALSRDAMVGDMFEVSAAPASAIPNLQGGGATTVRITSRRPRSATDHRLG